MYGERARIGLIVPSCNPIMEPEFNAMKPEGVSVLATRVFLAGSTTETVKSLMRMDEETGRAAELLATAGVSIIAYGCTTGSMVGGLGWDQELINRIERTTNIPTTTTATAVMRAFRELGIEKVSIATPYGEELDRLEREFFEANGIKVVKIKGLSLNSQGMWLAPPETTCELACEVNTPEVDAVFISCTNFKSVTVIEKLEEKLQKYVLSSNIATMWDVLKRLGIHDQIKGYGKLMQRLSR